MKANVSFVPNKKLILHFDTDQVLRLSDKINKDFFVCELCADWVWGKLQKNSKEDVEKVTGWKIAQNTLSQESPEPQLVSYKSYLTDYVRPDKQEYEKLILNLSKGPASKAKSQIQKNIKNITLPKTIAQALKEGANPNNKLLTYYNKTGKYQILPAFYKLLLNLKKSKREFAIIIKNSNQNQNHFQIIDQLNQFFTGEHPLYNGKNGTPAVKWDGSKGAKNFVIEDSHQAIYYSFGQGNIYATFGTSNIADEKDPQLLKQKFKSYKSVRLCQGLQQIYAVSHSILAESACIYEVNHLRSVVIDPVDYLTQQIYFTNSAKSQIYSCLGEIMNDTRSMLVKVNLFDYIKDVDYFIKHIQNLEGIRATEITRIQKGEPINGEETNQQNAVNQQIAKESNHEYLKKHLLPVLQGALRQVDLFRPQDPIGFIALYCLKNKDRLE